MKKNGKKQYGMIKMETYIEWLKRLRWKAIIGVLMILFTLIAGAAMGVAIGIQTNGLIGLLIVVVIYFPGLTYGAYLVNTG